MKTLSMIKLALREDVAKGDITSKLIIPAKKRIKAVIIAKEGGVVCGLGIIRSVFEAVDKKVRFSAHVREGSRITRGKVLARLEGRALSILKAERVALNFLGRLSGIATLTAKFVQRARPYHVRIMDTRKTTPGLRILEKCAVRCGGGCNHRMGLWDQILIKDNHLHIAHQKDLQEIVKKARKERPRGMKIELEVKTLAQFKQALEARPDIIMLDNMSLKEINKAVAMRHKARSRIPIEVSGGVSLDNVRRIAACGVEMISVGELTHSAKALDVALNCE